ncbi:MAG: NADH-ubiquinone/plastoquinone oxidoreductase subunit 6 [Acidobacteria bacterium]|jgi:NADH-quinone oxidoreductase subunit J|nr:NADH-ubiquinone/plastoquinone oxidoreductase subunit 6 [Acidobacteriota bacterium]HJN42691.1 NADH-quinone oxidoreductase subunit J [Vicinamibacterales bacterium]|tara:strand:+ start:12670 stop:13194 length:525 start_codon:yes stop_codon:yes gene_type:complete
MPEAIAFYTLSVLILGLAILVVTAKNTVHSVVYLVINFLCVAALYVVLQAEFLAVIQVLVYAGGIVVLYLFVVMLVNLKREPEAHQDPRRLGLLGLVLAGAVLLELAGIVVYSYSREPSAPLAAASTVPAEIQGNIEQVGWLLYTDYLIPFEVASVLLLVAMIGAIVLAKRELQ